MKLNWLTSTEYNSKMLDIHVSAVIIKYYRDTQGPFFCTEYLMNFLN